MKYTLSRCELFIGRFKPLCFLVNLHEPIQNKAIIVLLFTLAPMSFKLFSGPIASCRPAALVLLSSIFFFLGLAMLVIQERINVNSTQLVVYV